MKKNLTAKTSISLNTTAAKVWKALTEPKLIKKYMFGTDVSSDWKEGSTITWSGEYEGKSYTDKGVIKMIEPKKILQHTYLSSMSGKEDKAENYATVTYTLAKKDDKIMLALTQDNNANEKARESSTKNWKMVLKKMKEVVENN
ncbi:MAG: SRPBCC family protein [Ferruginibacter sp.]